MKRILFLGDIVGRAGREAVRERIGTIRKETGADLVIANGENAAGGAGITGEIARQLHEAGVDGITLGDHCWDQRGFDKAIDELPFVCRPVNLLPGCPGAPLLILTHGDFRLAVLTVLGQQLIKIPTRPGFPMMEDLLEDLRGKADAIFVEMHAETTSEKVAMGWYLDGRVAAVIGTHTHMPTADLRRLPRGTAYLSDAGMCGPYDSVLGREVAPVLGRFLDGMPRRFTVAEDNVQLWGVRIDIEPGKRGCVAAESFREGID